MTGREMRMSAIAGFTLLELLVSLALLAVMAATMSLVLAQLRPIKALEQRLGEAEIADAILDVVARDLQATVRLPLMEGGTTSNILVSGGPEGVAFSAVVPTGFRRSGLREVTYEVRMGDKGESVLRGLKLRRFSSQDTMEKEEIDLGRFSLRFSYLTISEAGTRKWSDRFEEINALPKAVRLEMKSQASPNQRTSRVIVMH